MGACPKCKPLVEKKDIQGLLRRHFEFAIGMEIDAVRELYINFLSGLNE